MEYILLGVIVNTHGIKGEIRIISDFEFKEKVFKIGNKIYIGEKREEKKINSYRKHKNYDMITIKGINDIQDVLIYKGKKVYFNKEDLSLNEDEILDSDLINIEVYYKENNIGVIEEIINNNGYKLFKMNDKYIPYNKNFIEKIDIKNNKIILKNVEEILK